MQIRYIFIAVVLPLWFSACSKKKSMDKQGGLRITLEYSLVDAMHDLAGNRLKI